MSVTQIWIIGGALLIGICLLLGGRDKRKKGRRDGEGKIAESPKLLLEKLDAQRREVEELLLTARKTTESLRRMIGNYERTFRSTEPQDRSVTYIFEEMKRDLHRELGELQEDMQREKGALNRFRGSVQETRKVA